MEIQLQELIEQIKAKGVVAAETEAAAKLSAAQTEAERIIAEAKAKAETIVNQAKEENERLVRVSEDAIRQAGRNLMITFRESVTRELNAIVGEQVAKGYGADAVSALIPKVVEAWSAKSNADDISVLLNAQELAGLEDDLMAALKERMLGGVTLKTDDSFQGGFRIAVDNGRAYYDYSSEAIAEMFAAYLNPKVAALLKEADRV